MAIYTMSLAQLIEKNFEVFNFDYKLYDNTQKPRIQNLFLNHFYLKEISYETPEIWKYALKTKWIELLPKYNKLWLANSHDINVLQDHTETRSTKSELKRNDSASGKQVYKDLPITEYDTNDQYATNLTKTENSGEGVSKGDTSETVSGLNQLAITALDEYNTKLIDIDMLFINEFKSLFMQIY